MTDQVSSAVALLDWDNVNRVRVTSAMDADIAISESIDLVAPRVLEEFPDVVDLQLWLYGSWEWRGGRSTSFRNMLSAAAAGSNRRLGHCYITVTAVESLAVQREQASGRRLVPYLSPSKCRCPSRADINEQKLADTMIVADAVYLSIFPDQAVIIVSDDKDMLPGALLASNFSGSANQPSRRVPPVAWLRPFSKEPPDYRPYIRYL